MNYTNKNKFIIGTIALIFLTYFIYNYISDYYQVQNLKEQVTKLEQKNIDIVNCMKAGGSVGIFNHIAPFSDTWSEDACYYNNLAVRLTNFNATEVNGELELIKDCASGKYWYCDLGNLNILNSIYSGY